MENVWVGYGWRRASTRMIAAPASCAIRVGIRCGRKATGTSHTGFRTGANTPSRGQVIGCHSKGSKRAVHFFRSIFQGLHDVFSDARVRGLLLFTLSLIGMATVMFWLLEGWTLLDAAFFSVVTISTVGYGEIVPQTVAGKLFCMAYILMGLGVFVAAASSVAEALIRRQAERVRK